MLNNKMPQFKWKVATMMQHADLICVRLSERAPYWCAVGLQFFADSN
jgi:hypothetical protein